MTVIQQGIPRQARNDEAKGGERGEFTLSINLYLRQIRRALTSRLVISTPSAVEGWKSQTWQPKALR
jgi:hypothetical protein